MTDSYGARDPTVTYRDGDPHRITVTGWHRDGEFKRRTECTFRVHGTTAVLTHIKPDDDSYQVQLARSERDAVRETVAELPQVQAVSMFTEVDE